jgi:hypothetical protein
MCLLNVLRCPRCLDIRPIPYLCPTKELSFRRPAESALLVWDTACNRKWCLRNSEHPSIIFSGSPRDSCSQCHSLEECSIQYVSYNCWDHRTRREREGEACKVYKSMFRAQLNAHPSGNE